MELILKLLGVTTAYASTGNGDGNGGGFGATLLSLLFTAAPLILMFALMYFLMIRPEKKRKKKEAEMLAALKHGDRICTIGGIYGTITGIKDDTITLTVGRENMTMVVARWAIRSVEDVSIENDSEALN